MFGKSRLSAVTDWVRRCLRLGPTRAQLAAEAEVWRQRCERKDAAERAAHARAKAAEALVRRIRHELHEQLNEPGRVDGCQKVRFHRQPEAADWAASIAAATGEDPAVYDTYQCKRCPRSPVTHYRYWHAGHDGSAAARVEKEAGRRRSAGRRREAVRAGKLISQQIGPDVMAKLRKIGNG